MWPPRVHLAMSVDTFWVSRLGRHSWDLVEARDTAASYSPQDAHCPLKARDHLVQILLVWSGESCDFAVVQSLRCVQLFATPRTVASQAPLSTISQGLLKFLSIESVILSHPLLPPSPFAFYLAQQQSLFQ